MFADAWVCGILRGWLRESYTVLEVDGAARLAMVTGTDNAKCVNT